MERGDRAAGAMRQCGDVDATSKYGQGMWEMFDSIDGGSDEGSDMLSGGSSRGESLGVVGSRRVKMKEI
jgi:hypothetical protein